MTLILHARGVKINEEEVLLDLKGPFGWGETERIKNSGEKIDIMGVWLRREGKNGKLVGPMCFLSLPTKIISLQFREENKGERNSCKQ